MLCLYKGHRVFRGADNLEVSPGSLTRAKRDKEVQEELLLGVRGSPRITGKLPFVHATHKGCAEERSLLVGVLKCQPQYPRSQ